MFVEIPSDDDNLEQDSIADNVEGTANIDSTWHQLYESSKRLRAGDEQGEIRHFSAFVGKLSGKVRRF